MQLICNSYGNSLSNKYAPTKSQSHSNYDQPADSITIKFGKALLQPNEAKVIIQSMRKKERALFETQKQLLASGHSIYLAILLPILDTLPTDTQSSLRQEMLNSIRKLENIPASVTELFKCLEIDSESSTSHTLSEAIKDIPESMRIDVECCITEAIRNHSDDLPDEIRPIIKQQLSSADQNNHCPRDISNAQVLLSPWISRITST